MTHIAVQPLEAVAHRIVSWSRIVLVSLAALTLVALSFVLGRVTMEHTATTTTIIRPAVVQPAGPSPADAQSGCHVHAPC